MNRALKITEEKCAAASKSNDAKHCRVARICEKMSAHPKVMLGMLVERIRPLALSRMFCAGSRACDHPAEPLHSVLELANSPVAGEELLGNCDEIDMGLLREEVDELEPSLPDEELTQDGQEAIAAPNDEKAPAQCASDEGMPKVCPRCMKRAMR